VTNFVGVAQDPTRRCLFLHLFIEGFYGPLQQLVFLRGRLQALRSVGCREVLFRAAEDALGDVGDGDHISWRLAEQIVACFDESLEVILFDLIHGGLPLCLAGVRATNDYVHNINS